MRFFPAQDDQLVEPLEADLDLGLGPGHDRCPPAADALNGGDLVERALPRRIDRKALFVAVLVHGAHIQGRACTSQDLIYPAACPTLALVCAEAAFAALAEPRRREMLMLVRDQSRPVSEIAEHFDISQQAVSQHLKVLREAGLVAVRPERQRRLYMVRPEGFESLEAFLADLWPSGLRRLKAAVEADDAR